MKSSAKRIRLLLADDHPLVRAGIRFELEKLPLVEVIGEAGHGREALEMIKSKQPDMVFMDISMPGLNGLEALARITKEYPEVRVIILSMHNNEEYIWRAMRTGAAGYLLKKAATAELGAALHHIARGEVYLCREIAAHFAKQPPWQGIAGRKSPLEKLTDRQREILQLIAEGRNTKSIGEILKLSPKTVEYHRMKLMRTLNVHDIPRLVRFALQAGLATQES